MAHSFRRVAVLGWLGSTIVAAACSSGGPGALQNLLDAGELTELDGAFDGRPNDRDGGGKLDATLFDGSQGQDGAASDAFATLDGSDSSVTVQCNEAGTYPDASPGAAVFAFDNTYATSGVRTLNFGTPGSTYGAGMARQPDGKLLLGLKVGWNSYTVGVARFLATGGIDTSFGTNGVVFVPLGMESELAGVLLQSTGKIVLVGQSDFFGNSSTKSWLVRLDSTGAIDTSFGTNGMVIVTNTFEAAALQTDDAILVTASRPPNGTPSVARFQANGTLDATFGSGGYAGNTNLPSRPNVVFQQADGKILVGVGDPRAMARLTASGALDTSFGDAGTIIDVRDDAGSVNHVRGFAQQADGKIIAAGRKLDAFGVQRLTASGAADPTFGNGSWGTFPSDAGPIWGSAIAASVQSDGKVLAAGTLNPFVYGVGRFQSDGGVDTTYGTGGYAASPFNAFGRLTAMVPAGDGGIVAVGGDQLNYNTNIWVTGVSMLGANGTLNASFGDGGASFLAAGATHDEALGIAIQPSDGKAIVVGTTAPDRNYTAGGVVRLGTTGALDPSFAGTGMRTITGTLSPTSVAVATTGRIVVGSQSYFGSQSNQNGFMIQALLSDGGVDPGFGADGGVVSVPNFNGKSIALGPTDHIAAVGEALPNFSSTGNGFLVSAFSATGQPSAGWGDAGAGKAFIVTTPASKFGGAQSAGASAGAVQSDGKIVAVGYAGQNLALARYTTSGTLDTTFGVGGVVTIDAGESAWIVGSFRIVIQPSDGALVVAGLGGHYGQGMLAADLVLARLDTEGQLDCTFGAGGIAKVAVGVTEGTPYSQPLPIGLALAQDGRIYVTTTTSADGIKEDALLMRFTTAGFVDARSTVRLGPGLDLGHAVAVQADGKVLVAGRTWTQAGLEDFFVARFAAPP